MAFRHFCTSIRNPNISLKIQSAVSQPKPLFQAVCASFLLFVFSLVLCFITTELLSTINTELQALLVCSVTSNVLGGQIPVQTEVERNSAFATFLLHQDHTAKNKPSLLISCRLFHYYSYSCF